MTDFERKGSQKRDWVDPKPTYRWQGERPGRPAQMGLQQNVVDGFKSALNLVTAPLKTVPQVAASAVSGLAPTSMQPMVQENVPDVAAKLGEAVTKSTIEGATWYDQKVFKPWSQKVAATFLTVGEEAAALRDGEFYNPIAVWQRAHDAADRENQGGISQGQAAFYALQQLNTLMPFGLGGQITRYAPVIDPFDPAQRELYKTNPLLKYVTGVLDITSSIFLDPTVIGGKVFTGARLALTAPKTIAAKGIFKTASEAAEFSATATARSQATIARSKAVSELNANQVRVAQLDTQIRAIKDKMATIEQTSIFDSDYITAIDDLARQKQLLEDARPDLLDSLVKAQQAWDDARALPVPTAASGPADFVRQVFDHDMTAAEIANHYTVRRFGTNSADIGSIIEAAKRTGDELAVMDVLQAAYGDVNSYARLNDSYAALHEMLRRTQGDYSRMSMLLKAAETHHGDVAEFIADNKIVQERIAAELKSLEQLDGSLATAVNPDRSINIFNALERGFASTETIVSKVRKVASGLPTPAETLVNRFGNAVERVPSMIEDVRAARARTLTQLESGAPVSEAVAGWTAQRFQMHRLARPVTVLQWTGGVLNRENPSGWVALFGMNSGDGAQEMKAWLNSVKAFTPEQRQKYLNGFINAGQRVTKMGMAVGDIRWKMIEMLERKAFLAEAETINPAWMEKLLDSAGKPIKHPDGGYKVVADNIWDAFTSKRKKQIDFILSTRGEGKRAYGVDETGEVIKSHIFDSQLAYSMPIADMLEIRQAFKEANDTGALGWARSFVYSDFAKTDVSLADIAKQLTPQGMLYRTFDRLWRPAVLLRLGYTQRNVLEGTLRSIAYLGHMSALLVPLAGEGVKNASSNAAARLIAYKNRLNAWNEFLALGGEPPQGLFDFGTRVPGKTWIGTIEQEVESQATMLNMMREFHVDMRDAYRATAADDLAEALADVDALKKIKPTPTESLLDARNRVKDARNRLTIADDDSQWFTQDIIDLSEKRLNDFSEVLRKTIQTYVKNKKTIGETTIALGPHNVPGVFSNPAGEITKGLLSSESRKNVDMNLNSTLALDYGKLVADKWVVVQPPRFGTGRSVQEIAGDAAYWANLERFIQQLSNDSLAEKILAEVPKHTTVPDGLRAGFDSARAWLRTADGKTYLERIKKSGEFGDSVVADTLAYQRMNQIWSHVVGDEQFIRKMASKDRVLSAELRAKLFDSDGLLPIHGEDLAYLKEAVKPGIISRVNNVYDKTVSRLFEILGSIPEDKLVRHPFAVMTYKRFMAEKLADFDASGAAMTNELMAEFVAQGRAVALRDTRRVLYTIARKKSAANSIVAVSPFIQAQQNSLTSWGKLLYENPSAFGYGQQAWRNLDKLGTVEKDPDTGETFLTFRLPNVVANVVDHVSPAMANAIRTFGEWRFRKSGFNVILQGYQGEDAATQFVQMMGISAPVQIMVGEYLKHVPDLDETLAAKGIVFPVRSILKKFVPDNQLPREYTTLGAIGSQLLPAWMRNLYAAYDGQDSSRFANTVMIIAKNKLAQQDLGYVDSKSMRKILMDAEHEATMFMFVRAAANLSLPIVPQYETALKPYMQELRRLQDQLGMQKGYEKFLEDNPNMWYMNASLTSNPSGMDSTTLSVFLAKKHRNLLDEIVGSDPDNQKYVSMLTDTTPVGKFDVAANLWKRGSGFVKRKNVGEALEDSDRAAGWVRFHQVQEAVDAALKSRGLQRISEAPDLGVKKNTILAALSEAFPAWGKDYANVAAGAWKTNVTTLRRVAFDPAIVKDKKNYGHMAYVRAYFEMRDAIAQALLTISKPYVEKRLGAVPSEWNVEASSLTIDAKAAEKLKLLRDSYVASLRENEMFAQLYDRWLDNDPMTYLKGGQ